MIVNAEKLTRELEAAGHRVKAVGARGRIVLASGLVLDPDGANRHELSKAVTLAESDQLDAVAAIRAAHDPSPTVEQTAERLAALGGGDLGALAVVLADGALAPGWARDRVRALADRARAAR